MEILGILTLVAGSIGAATTVVVFLIKFIKFLINVRDKIKVIDKSEELIKIVAKQGESIEHIVSVLNDLCKKFDLHVEDGKAQTDMMINQAKYTLETVMKKSIQDGWAPIDEKQRVSDLFESYRRNGGNHGVAQIYTDYQKLPTFIN